MAAWQFDVFLVPKQNLDRISVDMFEWVEVFDGGDSWLGHTVPEEAIGAVTRDLTPLSSWDASVSSWGSEDGNRLDIMHNKGAIEEIRGRIDARRIDEEFLEALVTLATAAECVFVTHGQNVHPALASELTFTLRDSAAMRFAKDSGLEGPGVP